MIQKLLFRGKRYIETKHIFFWSVLLGVVASIPYFSRAFKGEPGAEGYVVCCVMINIATAWSAYYSFGNIFGEWTIGAACSALYTLSVYRLSKLILGAEIGVSVALIFVPVVLYGLWCIFTEEIDNKKHKNAWFYVVIGYAGILQTNMQTFGIVLMLTLLFCVSGMMISHRRRRFCELFKGIAVAILVGLFCGTLLFKDYVEKYILSGYEVCELIQAKGLQPAEMLFHFGIAGMESSLDETGMKQVDAAGIGLVLICALGLFLILWFAGKLQNYSEQMQKKKQLLFMKTVALTSVLLMCMSLNLFPWDRIQCLHPLLMMLANSLGSPNCFLGCAIGCMVMMFGFCMWYLKKCDVKRYWLMLVVAYVGVANGGVYFLNYTNAEWDLCVPDGFLFWGEKITEHLLQPVYLITALVSVIVSVTMLIMFMWRKKI